jgi:CRISPR-associated protein Cas1
VTHDKAKHLVTKIVTKLKGSAGVLILRAGRDAAAGDRSRLQAIADTREAALASLSTTASPDVILGIEGQAARGYFDGINLLCPGASPGRSRRPPLDPAVVLSTSALRYPHRTLG